MKNKNTTSKLYNYVAIAALLISSLAFTLTPAQVYASKYNTTNSYLLQNPTTALHLQTASLSERNHLISIGWVDKGAQYLVGSQAGSPAIYPFYRLYKSSTGQHHLTISNIEKTALISNGWSFEGVDSYILDASQNWTATLPLYRLYNATTGDHRWTASASEKSALITAGWIDEGIAGRVFPL